MILQLLLLLVRYIQSVFLFIMFICSISNSSSYLVWYQYQKTIYQQILDWMKTSKSIMIYYTFQLEESSEYNIIRYQEEYQQLSDIKIKNVVAAFPFDAFSGHYHFRFKSEFQEGNERIIAWIDISNLNAKVPIIRDSIYVKILKIKSNSYNKLFSREKLYSVFPQLKNGSSNTTSSKQKQPTFPIEIKSPTIINNPPSSNSRSNKDDILTFENPTKKKPETIITTPSSNNNLKATSPTTKINNVVSPKLHQPKDDLFNFEEDHLQKKMSAPQNQNKVFSTHLLSNPTPVEIKATNIKNQEIHLLHGMDQVDIKVEVPTTVGLTTQEMLQQFKTGIKKQQKEKEEQAAIRGELDEIIEKWAYSSKIRKNFRALLVTVHQIWDYGNWNPVTLADLLTDKDLRKFYNRSQLVFHPDKNRDMEPRRKYLSKRISSELSEAFKKI